MDLLRMVSLPLLLLAILFLIGCGGDDRPTVSEPVADVSPQQAFADTALEHAVRVALDLGEELLRSEALLTLTTLSAVDMGIEQLDGIEALTQLTSLQLSGNRIVDLHPLAALNSLRSLDLANNAIEDLSPLASLTKLQFLNVSANPLSDLEPLAALSALLSLILTDGAVVSLEPLLKLPSLISLEINRNPLGAEAYATHIPRLQERGVQVVADPAPVIDTPGVPGVPSQIDPDFAFPLGQELIVFASDRPLVNGNGINVEIFVAPVSGDTAISLADTLENFPLADGSSPDEYGRIRYGEWPTWSPTGDRIVFVTWREGNKDIYRIDRDGTDPVNLTAHERQDEAPAWSPDGTRIAFVSDREGEIEKFEGSGRYNADLYIMNVDGSGVERLTHDPAGINSRPSWSPDGGRIAFGSGRSGNSELYSFDLDLRKVVQLTFSDTHEWSPVFSPVGERIAFIRPDEVSEGTAVHVLDLATGEEWLVSDSPGWVEGMAWSPDGTQIILSRQIPNGMRYDLHIVNADGGGEFQWSDGRSFYRWPDWSRR